VGQRTCRLVRSPESSSNTDAVPKSVWVQQSFLSFGAVECGSSTGILWILIESQFSSPAGVSGFRLVGIPMILHQSGWFTNHSKSFIRFSYVIGAFTYRIVELVFVLSYIWSHVWWSIEYSGTPCGDYYLIPQRLTALIRRKIRDSAVDVVSEALSMHVAPPAVRTIVAPAGVTVLLGLRNPPHSWIGMVGPSLPDFTIAPCLDSFLCYWSIRWPKSILQDSPKIYGTCMHSYNCIWVVLLVPRLNLAFVSQKLSRGIDIVTPQNFKFWNVTKIY
jgi:hypothetical protein